MKALSGLKALVVEDEGSVALLIEDLLLDLGCEIAVSVANLPCAREVARTGSSDLAVIDLNLVGPSALPVTAILRERAVPFALSTGHGAAGVLAEFHEVPVLGKPFMKAQFRNAILSALP